jgi:hypothetical protein
MSARSLPEDVRPLSWAAEQLAIGTSTAYRLAPLGRIPGAFKVGAQWRVSVPRFLRDVHGAYVTDAGKPIDADADAEFDSTRNAAAPS